MANLGMQILIGALGLGVVGASLYAGLVQGSWVGVGALGLGSVGLAAAIIELRK